MKRFLTVCFTLVLLATTSAYAQVVMTNLDDTVRVVFNTTISVKGSVWNKQLDAARHPVWYNADSIYISDTVRNDGGNTMFFHQLPSGQVLRNGVVNLTGNNQFIKGNDSITFQHLIFSGGGVVTQEVSASVKDTLDIDTLELDTQDNYMTVLNPLTTSMQWAEPGFVSSDRGGWLARYTSLVSNYVYPTGEVDAAVPRYRPVTLRPNGTDLHRYDIRFANYDPQVEGFTRTQMYSQVPQSLPDSVCRVNEFYFHHIARIEGTQPTDITLVYEPSLEDSFSTNAHWKLATPAPLSGWQIMNPTNRSLGTRFARLTTPGWSQFDTTAFILGYRFPDASFDPLEPSYCSDSREPVTIHNAQPTPTPFRGEFWVRDVTKPNAVQLPDSVFIPADLYSNPLILDSLRTPLPDGSAQMSGFVEVKYVFDDVYGCRDSATQIIELLQSPLVGVEFLTSRGTDFCGSDTVDIRAIPLRGRTAADELNRYEYEWFNASTGQIISRSRVIRIWYTVELQLRVYDRINGCNDTLDQRLTFRIYPKPSLDFRMESENTFVCEGETVMLHSNTPPTTSTTWTYEWFYRPTLNDTVVSMPQTTRSIPVTFEQNGSGYYSVKVTDPTTPARCDTTSKEIYIYFIEIVEPTITTHGETKLCRGESVLLSVAPDTLDYFWFRVDPSGQVWPMNDQANDGTTLLVSETGRYYVGFSHDKCGYREPDFSHPLTGQAVDIFINEGMRSKPMVDRTEGLIQDVFVFTEASVNDQFAQDPIIEWEWDMGDSTKYQRRSVQHAFQNPGKYNVVLTVRSRNGCVDRDTLHLRITERYVLDIPNVFTPNGDGVNDQLDIVHMGIKDVDFTIYDRWGTLVHLSRNLYESWNGTDMKGNKLPEGVYVFSIRAKTLRDKEIENAGTITLLR